MTSHRRFTHTPRSTTPAPTAALRGGAGAVGGAGVRLTHVQTRDASLAIPDRIALDGKLSTVVRSKYTVWAGAQAKAFRNFAI